MNADGSGNLVIHYSTEKEMKFQHLYFPVDKYEIEYNLQRNYKGDGLGKSSYNVLQKEEETHVYMRMNFVQLEKLNAALRFRDEKFTVSSNDGRITLQRFIYFDETQIDKTKLLLKSGIKSFFQKGILDEIRFRFQWIVPGKIVDSNATLHFSKNYAIWITTLADILENRTTRLYVTYLPDATAGKFKGS